MIFINLYNRRWDRSTTPRGEAFLCGSFTALDDGARLDLHTAIGEVLDSDGLMSLMKGANGFGAIVIRAGNRVVFSVDHLRSLPLFYARSLTGDFYVSDRAEWVRSQVADLDMDPTAREEFALTGYVTGRDTLYPLVKQLQAGELASIEDHGKEAILQVRRYFTFSHIEPSRFDSEVARSCLDTIAVRSFERLIDFAAGRQLVVPLSGGFDSRLVLSMLRRLKQENVLCFSYGRAHSKEAKKSQRIAASLGYPWTYVEYSDERWREGWTSAEASQYRDTAGNHSSLPHMQDWLAIKVLAQSRLVQPNAVVLPGHCCVTSFIPSYIGRVESSRLDARREVIKRHYSCAPQKESVLLNRQALQERVGSLLQSAPSRGTASGFVTDVMSFNWAERQSKYIANSVRAYEQFGLDYWLPLWDREFVEFWERFPALLRVERTWYKEWVVHLYRSSIQTGCNGESFVSRHAGRYVPSVLRTLLKRAVLLCFHRKHDLAVDALVHGDELRRMMSAGYSIIGVYSKLYLDGRWGPQSTLPPEIPLFRRGYFS